MKSKTRALGALLSLAAVSCGARSQLDVWSASEDAATVDAAPAPQSCSFQDPTPIADIAFAGGGFRADMQVSTLTSAKGTLYVGAWIQDGDENGDGFIASVPTKGGSLGYVTGATSDTSNLLHYVGGDIVRAGGDLYYPQPTFIGDYAIEQLAVTRRSLATGKEDLVPNPISSGTQVFAIAAAGAGIVWLTMSEDTDDAWLLRWDGSTTTLLASFAGYWPSGPPLVTTSTSAYVGSNKELMAFPFTGGKSQIVTTWQPEKGALLAANATSVFYTIDGTTIVRRDEATGAETTIATGLTGRIAAANAESLYVMTLTDIVRVPVDGGTPVTITTSSSLDALGVDECNVYWADAKPDFSGDQLVMALGTKAR